MLSGFEKKSVSRAASAGHYGAIWTSSRIEGVFITASRLSRVCRIPKPVSPLPLSPPANPLLPTPSWICVVVLIVFSRDVSCGEEKLTLPNLCQNANLAPLTGSNLMGRRRGSPPSSLASRSTSSQPRAQLTMRSS
jgi:hypothetical protein